LKNVIQKKSILIVDDDVSVTQMLRMLLETRGYVVNVAASGEDAFNSVSASTDLILLDLVLPDNEGFDICRKFKENRKTHHIPIIILSGRMLSEDIIEGLYLGADDYLIKPFEYEELIARMEVVMRRGSLFGSADTSSLEGNQGIIIELRKIIDEKLIIPFFQPIFDIKSSCVYGLEMLTRCKTQTILANPELLFKAAINFGFYQDLELLAWEKTLSVASGKLTEEILFLNCNPYLVEGPKFLSIKTLFDNSPINPKRVVLEITERSYISDFKMFFEHLRRYRGFGFRFAVDDVGGGYAGLESIVEIRPELVKIDRHIISELDKDPLKQSIVKFIIAFCKENNIISIAEGIETKAELETVIALGIDAAQGYYLCKPTSEINIKEMNEVAKRLMG